VTEGKQSLVASSQPPLRLLDDCFLHDKDRLRHDQAIDILKSNAAPTVGKGPVPLEHLAGRFLAEDIEARRAVPPADNSAVDGYAVRFVDLTKGQETSLPVAVRIAAGDMVHQLLPSGMAAQIFTGAPMPPGADTIVMQEDVRITHDGVIIPDGVKQGANRRRTGEDVRAGDKLLTAGQRLRPQDIAAIASAGIDSAMCFDPVRVALFSTGDELVNPGSPADKHHIYDSNRFLLRALLATLPVDVDDLGVLRDERDDVQSAMAEAAKTYHLLITSGGVSRGEEDHLVEAIQSLGSLHAWQLAIKPGRPMAFGQIKEERHDTVFLGLPGNPVAAMVCFLLYARPLILRLAGGGWTEPQRFMVPATFDLASKPDRREFLRGWLRDTEVGPQAEKFDNTGSGIIRSLRAAHGLIEIPEEITALKVGDPVAYIPFSEFGILG